MNKNNCSSPITRLDLNLFRVFAAIYRERNLTRAAELLSVSQSAVSHALARMRQQLDDQLFIREAQGVVPTPLATRIWPDVQEGLGFLQRAVTHSHSFEPSRDITTVTLAMLDVIEPALLPRLVNVLRRAVPNIRVSSARIKRTTLKADLATGRLDCAIDVAQTADDELFHSFLSRDEFVVVSRSSAAIDSESYLAAQHVTVSSRRMGYSVVDFELARQSIKRQIAARCQHYESACRLVAGSDLLLTMPRGLAISSNAYLDNHIHPLPMTVPGVELHLFWHRERESDPANTWLRHTLLTAMQ
ncbi:MAG: LysR family transcriptional regulator [Marinobacter sp.]|nr:LysR family transcriptional regulator [Marinobacter sp.]